MAKSITMFVLLAMFLTGFSMVQGHAVQAADNYAANSFFSDDPNEPAAPESGLALGQIVYLSEDPNDGGAAE